MPNDANTLNGRNTSATNQRRNNAKPTPRLLKVLGRKETIRLFSSQHSQKQDADPTPPPRCPAAKVLQTLNMSAPLSTKGTKV